MPTTTLHDAWDAAAHSAPAADVRRLRSRLWAHVGAHAESAACRAPAAAYRTEASDLALSAAVRAGDPAAFDAVVTRWAPKLVGWARRQVAGDEHAAESLVYDALLAIWNRRDSLELGRSARPLVFRILRDAVVDYQRRRGRALPLVALADGEGDRWDAETAHPDLDPFTRLSARSDLADVMEGRLPRK